MASYSERSYLLRRLFPREAPQTQAMGKRRQVPASGPRTCTCGSSSEPARSFPGPGARWSLSSSSSSVRSSLPPLLPAPRALPWAPRPRLRPRVRVPLGAEEMVGTWLQHPVCPGLRGARSQLEGSALQGCSAPPHPGCWREQGGRLDEGNWRNPPEPGVPCAGASACFCPCCVVGCTSSYGRAGVGKTMVTTLRSAAHLSVLVEEALFLRKLGMEQLVAHQPPVVSATVGFLGHRPSHWTPSH